MWSSICFRDERGTRGHVLELVDMLYGYDTLGLLCLLDVRFGIKSLLVDSIDHSEGWE